MYGTSKFYNNVINLGNAQSNALSFLRIPSLGGTGSVEIVNNTVFTQRAFHGIWVEDVEAPIVRNNISYTISGAALTITRSTSSAGVSNNLTSGDPKFVNMSALDFHLQSNSPAINTGVSMGAPYNSDKDGKTRPQGSAWDIGAYEYGSGGVVSTTPPTPSPTATPTIKPGDANNDTIVNLLDFDIWKRHYAQTISGITNGNFNGDSKVDGIDYVIWLNNFGK